MSARADSEAERLRRCRALFARATADGVSMGEARLRLLDERIGRRAGHPGDGAAQLCGTAVPDFGAPEMSADDDNHGRFWWQRD